MKDEEYIAVEMARERLGISHREMSLLLKFEALRSRKDGVDETIRWVCVDDVEDARAHLARYRREEKERLQRFAAPEEPVKERNADDISYFTFSDTDLMMLLLAAISYFDAERDIYFRAFDERAAIEKTLRAISKLYSRLEKESKAGRPMSEIVGEIYEQQPDHKSRHEVFRYLMKKARFLGENAH
jgi:hypothetical protein